YDNGNKVGFWVMRYYDSCFLEDSSKCTISYLLEDILTEKEFSKEKILRKECDYINDLEHGEVKIYTHENVLVKLFNYKYGKKNGSFTIFYPTGEVYMQGYY